MHLPPFGSDEVENARTRRTELMLFFVMLAFVLVTLTFAVAA